jgi:outer membrane receptor protein involved in Fe transport
MELSGYRNRLDNFIFVAPTSQFVDTLRVYQAVQARATTWGGEATAAVDPIAALTIRAQADYVHGTNDETGRPLPLMPPLRGALTVELHGRLGPGRAYAGLETELVGRQTRLGTDSIPGQAAVTVDIPTAGYALFHLEAGLERRLAGRHTRFDVRVRNAANTRYRDFLNRYKEFALDAGRDVVIRLSTDF